MAKKTARAGIALTIVGLVGGTYRLVSAYSKNTKLDTLNLPAPLQASSNYDLTEVSSTGESTNESDSKEPEDFISEPAFVAVHAHNPEVTQEVEEDMDETISVEFPCIGKLWENGRLSQRYSDLLFRWELTLNGKEDKARLRAKKTIVKTATVSVIRNDNGKKLWDQDGSNNGDVKAIEAKWKSTGTIEITLKSWVKGVINVFGSDQGGSLQDVYLYCQNTGLNNGWEKVFYKDGDLGKGNFGRTDIGNTPMSLKVSLGQCVNKENGIAKECDLKIITGNWLQWKSNKFKTRVTLINNKK